MSTMNDIRVAKVETYIDSSFIMLTGAIITVREEIQAIINLPDNIENSEKNKARREFAEMVLGNCTRLASELAALRQIVLTK